MSRPSLASASRPGRAILAGLAGAALLFLAACGGAPDDASEPGDSTTAAEARASGETHSHEGAGEHAHEGDGSHTHAAADTLVSGVALDPGPDAGWTGSATLLAVGDSLRVLVSVEGASAGTRRSAVLVAGSCDAPGPELASLTPVAVGSSGKGSSQTTLPVARLDDHAHGAVRMLAEDGSPAACAPVHLSASEHGHG